MLFNVLISKLFVAFVNTYGPLRVQVVLYQSSGFHPLPILDVTIWTSNIILPLTTPPFCFLTSLHLVSVSQYYYYQNST